MNDQQKALKELGEELAIHAPTERELLLCTIAFHWGWEAHVDAGCAEQVELNKKWLAPVVDIKG